MSQKYHDARKKVIASELPTVPEIALMALSELERADRATFGVKELHHRRAEIYARIALALKES